MAISGYHVNGPALVYTSTGGGGAFQLLGYTDNGVDITIEHHTSPIITDVMGPLVPQDMQEMGLTATIVAPLIASDRTVLSSLMNRANPGTGNLGLPGLVMGVNLNLFKVAIASLFETPWIFQACCTRPRFGTKLATKANPFRMEFFAFPYAPYTTTNGLGTPVWARTAIPGA